MKSIFEVITFVTIISLSQCANMTCENNLPLSDEVFETELLSFSFNKVNFDDFRCNVSNATLSHSSLYKPPFYESESVRNFLSTLCLFFQYAEIKKNTRFKKNIEILFENYSKKIHNIKGGLTEYTYDPQTFQDRLLKLDETIKNILEEQDPNKQIVTVEKQGDRIIITQKQVSKNINFKIVEEGIKEFSEDYLEDDALVAWYEYFIKLCELYLEGSIGNSFKKYIFNILENIKKIIDAEYNVNCVLQKEPTTSETGIYDLYSKIKKIINSSDSISKTFKCHSLDYEFSDEEMTYLTNKCQDILINYVNGNVPEYLYELFFKVNVKITWCISEGLTDDIDLFYRCRTEDVEPMVEMKVMINDYLQDPEKIFFYNELSKESKNNLVKICLELIL